MTRGESGAGAATTTLLSGFFEARVVLASARLCHPSEATSFVVRLAKGHDTAPVFILLPRGFVVQLMELRLPQKFFRMSKPRSVANDLEISIA